MEHENCNVLIVCCNYVLIHNIQGYYKGNRHIQCCIETKLLMIYPKYLRGFVVHVLSLYGEFTNVLYVILTLYKSNGVRLQHTKSSSLSQ
jgi:hypothetical protein